MTFDSRSQTFSDLCAEERVTDPAQRLRLLLLLGGRRLRQRLAELKGNAETSRDYEGAIAVLSADFFRRRNCRSARFNMLFSQGRPLPGERPSDWRGRLLSLANDGCDFSAMCEKEAAVLVMCRHCPDEEVRHRVLSAGTAMTADEALTLLESAYAANVDVEPNGSDDVGEEHVKVELQWGENEESSRDLSVSDPGQ